MEDSSAALVQSRIKDLWETTDFSATLFESLVGYAVIAADFDGTIIAFNEGARQIYGYDADEVLGKQNIEVFFPPPFLAAGYFQQIVDVLLATGRFCYEGEKVRKSGAHFPAQILFTLTKDRTGKVVGFVEIVQDLTERRQAEEELRTHRDHLESLVGERTAALAKANAVLQAEVTERKRVEAELQQRAQELAKAHRRKDEFLAMLAHELRNPLAPIRNALHILRQPGADLALVERVQEMMERQVQHMTRMVDDLLDVSRITRGKIELRKEVVDLAAVVTRTVEAIRPLLDDRGHELTLVLPPAPVPLEADPTRLEQVLANLLTNAAKYTDPGGHIGLSAQQEGAELVLRVKDTGMGLPADMLSRIFEPFVQSARVLHRSQGGLGIGLALVQSLVELHGGTVQAYSAGPGTGSEFVVRLPALSHPQKSGAVRAVGEGPQPGGAAPKRRILVVDDNVDAAESLALLLRLAGHEVRVAHDGLAALAAVDADPPDSVFLDIGMPRMNGYEVARRLRQRPGLDNLLLVAMTGWGQEEDRRRSREAGFDHHLIKPAEPEVLHQLLAYPCPPAC